MGLSIIWIFGGAVALFFACRRAIATRRMLNESQPPSSELLATVMKIARRVGRLRVDVRVSRHIDSPSIVVLGPAILLWPEHLFGQAGERNFDSILAHEMAHLKRGDHWVARLEILTGIVWWWNPAFWFIRRRLNETRELACDALALRATGGCPQEYALQLLEMAVGNSGSTKQMPEYGVGAMSHSSLKARLKMVFEKQQRAETSLLGGLVIAALAIPLAPAFSLGESRRLKKASPSKVAKVVSGSKSQGTPAEQKPAQSPKNDADLTPSNTREEASQKPSQTDTKAGPAKANSDDENNVNEDVAGSDLGFDRPSG